jgi:hypothetical protein
VGLRYGENVTFTFATPNISQLCLRATTLTKKTPHEDLVSPRKVLQRVISKETDLCMAMEAEYQKLLLGIKPSNPVRTQLDLQMQSQ